MQARAGRLPGRKQAGHRGAPGRVRRHAAAEVVRGRHNGHRAGRQVQAPGQAVLVDRGEPVLEEGRVAVADVQVHVLGAQALHLRDDHPRDHVPGGQLAELVVPAGEALPGRVQQPGALPAEGLREQEAALARQVQRGRVELHVLHALQLGAHTQGHGEAVAARAGRVGGVLVQVAEAARRQHRGRGQEGLRGPVPERVHAHAVAAVGAQRLRQVHGGAARLQGDVGVGGGGRLNALGDRLARVVFPVDDARAVVRGLQAERELAIRAAVKGHMGGPNEQLIYGTGAIVGEEINGFVVANIGASIMDVTGKQVWGIILRLVDDATLSPVGVAVQWVCRRREHPHGKALACTLKRSS
mmetsp:Transcript_3134/g.4524  ORF Transcript_3134/g.4524 Transcript_3134/m.4524 type:complete len:356 (+) Transcript_3134:1232-2299(+)